MSTIGIYKAGKPICFNKNELDHSAISVEITRVIEMLAEHSNQVFILSDTDYIPGSIQNVYKGSEGPLDKVFMYNGVGLGEEAVMNMLCLTRDVNLIVTDLSLLPDENVMQLFTNVYSQSKRFHTYGAIQEHECYKLEPYYGDKDISLYFGGTERGRTADFIEYVHRPDVMWYGKSKTLDIKKYVPYHKHIELMKRSTFSIVIGDTSYNNIGFVTPRYYECIRYGVIPFVDMKYDPDEIMIKKNDYRRVNSYIEVIQKIKELSSANRYMSIRQSQEAEISEKMKSGSGLVNRLLT